MYKNNIIIVNPWEMEIDPIATGKQLRKKRREASVSQEYLSEIITRYCVDSACKNIISKWETGKLIPSAQHLKFLAKNYGCTMDELIVTYSTSSADERDQPVPFYRLFFIINIFIFSNKQT